MASIFATVTRLGSGILCKWSAITNSDVPQPVTIDASLSDKTFSAVGTFDSGTIGLVGSLDPNAALGAFIALADHHGVEIAIDADGGVLVGPNVQRVAPGVPTGSNAEVDAYLLCE
jgi:hypothetical protein